MEVSYRVAGADEVDRRVGGANARLHGADAARLILVDAERGRLRKPRSELMMGPLTAAFRRDVLGRLPPGTWLSQADVLAWIDGDGLDVILGALRAGAFIGSQEG